MRHCTKSMVHFDRRIAWMAEGGAAIMAAVYKIFYFNDGSGIADMGYTPWGNGAAIMDTRREAQSGGFIFGKAQEEHSGLISNYDRSQTALLYLATRVAG